MNIHLYNSELLIDSHNNLCFAILLMRGDDKEQQTFSVNLDHLYQMAQYYKEKSRIKEYPMTRLDLPVNDKDSKNVE